MTHGTPPAFLITLELFLPSSVLKVPLISIVFICLKVIVLLRVIIPITPHYTFDINFNFWPANIEQRNQNTKFVLIDEFEVTAWIVLAKISAIERTLIFGELLIKGTESVTTSSSKAELLILSKALPERIG